MEKNLAFVLLRHWNKLRKEAEAETGAKRQVKYRNLVRDWAVSQGIAYDGDAIAKYAAATAQDLKVARATCKAAEKLESAVAAEFAAIVGKAIEKEWTVDEAARRLGRKKSAETSAAPAEGALPPLWEQLGPKGKGRFVLHLDRLRDGEAGTDELTALGSRLRALLAEVESLTTRGIDGPGVEPNGAEEAT